MSKKVIITGVSGMDGSNMADYLLENTNYLIYGMIRRSAKPDYSNIEKALKNPRFKLITGDLSDSQSIENIVTEIHPDYFINFAAQSFVGASWQIPEQTFEVGATGVLRCLEAIRKHAPHCRFYTAGSSEEFGDVIYSPQDESHPYRPQSPYGAAKVASRMLTRVYRESYGLYAIQGVLYNHEGIRRGEEFVTRKITKGVARIYHAIKNREKFEPLELGNLDAKRDWSDSEDFMDGVWRMMNQETFRQDEVFEDNYLSVLDGEWRDNNDNYAKIAKNLLPKHIKEYILSSGETHTVREFIELAFKAVGILGVWYNGINGKPEDEEYIFSENGQIATKAKITLVKINPKFYRPAEVKLLHGDSTLARNELGWKPKVSFQELVTKMVKNDIDLEMKK